MRTVNVVLGVLLGVLWIVGLNQGASAWLVWLDFCAAVLSIIVGLIPARTAGQFRISDGAIGVGLLVLWIIGLLVGATTWMVWWTFAFGIAYLIAAASTSAAERRGATFGRASHA